MERQGWKANIDWKKQKNVMQGDGRTGKLQSQLVQAHHTAANSPVQDYTHFVSLPLAFHHGLANKLINFRNKILRSEASSSEMGLKLKGQKYVFSLLIWLKVIAPTAVAKLSEVQGEIAFIAQ